MKPRYLALLLSLVLVFGLLTGCTGTSEHHLPEVQQSALLAEETAAPASSEGEAELELPSIAEPSASEAVSLTEAGPELSEEGTYSAPEEVAQYLHTYGHLPENYLTKHEAKALGWDSSRGNLWEVAPGKSIGGDRFGNYEGLLPAGNYRECDVNYEGGYRGAERLIFGEDGSIYYTDDHYKTFTQLYGEGRP